MDKLPKKIKSIRVCDYIMNYYELPSDVHYVINEGKNNETHICIPTYTFGNNREISNEIIDENDSFVNGFKLVKTANGKYAYIRESDNFLLPYRYAIATNFNEYGFAMVASDGTVSWIDKNFKYLNYNGEMIPDDNNRLLGCKEIRAFSKGNIPLSRICINGKIAYLGTDGKLKKFYQYENDNILNNYKTTFSQGSSFDEKGYATTTDKVLFARGYYITYEDLIRKIYKKGVFDSIIEDIEEHTNEENIKVLTK